MSSRIDWSSVIQDLDDDLKDGDGVEAIARIIDADEVRHNKDVHAWEGSIDRTWDKIDEGPQSERTTALQAALTRKGRLDAAAGSIKLAGGKAIAKGLIRSVVFILDMSAAMADTEDGQPAPLNPYGQSGIVDLVEGFIRNYFDQNPVSQLSLVVSHGGKAERLTDLSSNPKRHIEALRTFTVGHSLKGNKAGDFSFLNAIKVGKTKLTSGVSSGTREMLVLQASLASVDSGDIFEAIGTLKNENVRVSIIGLNAEMHVCKLAADATSGRYTIAQNKGHLASTLQMHSLPSEVTASQRGTAGQWRRWIPMGFPKRVAFTSPSFCACHNKLHYEGYVCPRCSCKLCEVPSDCAVCGISLASSSHLARSYHHLFPVPPFQIFQTPSINSLNTNPTQHATSSPDSSNTMIRTSMNDDVNEPEDKSSKSDANENKGSTSASTLTSMDPTTTFVACRGCYSDIDTREAVISICPTCQEPFCLDCDELIHTSLHNCPGCLSKPAMAAPPPTKTV